MNYGGEKAIYPVGGVAAGIGAGSTAVPLWALWTFLAAFALLALVLAVWRIVPRSEG